MSIFGIIVVVIIICAALMILALFFPMDARFAQAIKIVVGAVVLILIIYVAFILLSNLDWNMRPRTR
jgi:hypothetical protein